MASFRSCLTKVKGSTKSGAGSEEVYEPHWFAYHKMASFLRDKDKPKKTINTEVSIFSKIYFNNKISL